MRFLILFLFVSTFAFGQGIEPFQINGSPYKGGILKAVNKYYDENAQDSLYQYQHDSLVISSSLDSIYIDNDSLYYVLNGDTINVGVVGGSVSDSTIIKQSWGIKIDSSRNTYTVGADTSQLATQSDITGVVKGSGTENYVPKWNAANGLINSLLISYSDFVSLGYSNSFFGRGLSMQNTEMHPYSINGISFKNSIGATVGNLDYYSPIYANSSIADYFSFNTLGSTPSILFNTNAAGNDSDVSGDIKFKIAGNYNSSIFVKGSDGSGKVGINKNDASRTLHIGGEVQVDDLTTTSPTKIIGADNDGVLSGVTLGSGLSISGSTLNSSGASGSGTTNYVTKWTGTTSLGNSLIYDNGSNIGIGTTSPYSNLTNQSIDITDDYNGVAASGFLWGVSVADDYASVLSNDHIYGGGMLIKAGNDKNEVRRLLNVTNGDNTSRLIVRGNGYVGINNVSPSKELHVVGTGRFSTLAGSGDRMVIANSSGDLSTSSLPSSPDGSETKVTSGTNISVTGTGTTASPYVVNNTFAEVDGSTTNEIQDLSLSGNTLSLSSDATTVNLAPYLDNVTTNLTVSGTSSPLTINSSDGTDVTITAGTNVTLSGTAGNITINSTNSGGTVTGVTASSPLASSGGAAPNITIQNASGAQTGAITSTDWNLFNGKIGGSGTTNKMAYFTGTNSIGSSNLIHVDPTNSTLTINQTSAGLYPLNLVADASARALYAFNSLGTKGVTITPTTGTGPTMTVTGNTKLSGNIQNTANSAGTSGQVLTSQGTGDWIWSNPTEVDGSITNELQTISTTGAAGNITLSNGGGTLNLNVNDADASATNEIQDLSLSGNTLSLTSDGTTVNLAPYLDNVTTNLSISGASSPYTLNSSDGTDVTFTAGTNITLTGTSGNLTINSTASGDTDWYDWGTWLTPYGVSSTSGSGDKVQIGRDGTFGSPTDMLTVFGSSKFVGAVKDNDGDIGSSGQVLSSTGSVTNWVTPTLTEVDGNISNEGVLSVSGGISTSSVINSNTFGAAGVTINAGTGLSITESTASNGGSITLANSGDLLITNEGSLTVSTGTSTTSVINSNTSGSTGVTIEAGTGMAIAESGNTITVSTNARAGQLSRTNGSPFVIPATTAAKIDFIDELSTNMTISATNDEITIGQTGIHRVKFNTYINGAGNRRVLVYLYVNGVIQTPTHQTVTHVGSAFTPLHYEELLNLTASAVISIRAYYDNSSGSGTDLNFYYPRFSIEKVN
jgi:trimeric autotransporter adhesin